MNLAFVRLASLCIVIAAAGVTSGLGQSAPVGPANGAILIIRHAEKPESGTGLSDAGEKRASAYPEFFRRFEIDSKPAPLDFLFATRDSDNSQRPRLTLQPLGAALHLPVEAAIKNKDFGALAEQLKASKYNGKTILICWHHGHIPDFLRALGADPSRLLPEARWPENVFGWIVELRYDKDGQLKDSAVVNERLMPLDADTPPPGGR